MDPPLDPVVFQARAASYLRRKGRWDEDLCAEMVCYALEHPHVVLNLDLVYLRALDRLDPRHVQSGRGRVRQSRCTSALEDGPELATPDLMDLQGMPARGPLRAMLLLLLYGYSMREVAWLFGLTPSRLSQ